MSRGNQRAIAIPLVIATIVALCLLSTTAFAQGRAGRNRSQSRAAVTAAGQLPSATATNVGNRAWIYTSDFATSTPAQTTGSISISAVSMRNPQNDQANVTATFDYRGATYTVRVTCPFAASGQDFPNHGSVQFIRPVLGSSDLGTLGLPRTIAQVGIFARATISRNGRLVASNQPAVVLVNQALHGPDQTLLNVPSTSRNEISLIIPGPLNGQRFVRGFPNGYFYIYWPNSSLQMSNVTPTPLTGPPLRTGRGPVPPRVTAQGPMGAITISLNDDGISSDFSQGAYGLYDVTITNNSTRTRGVVMSGLDLCCSDYTRFSSLIGPGGSQTFRWYFAPGNVTLRDFTSGVKTRTAYTNVRYGGHSSSLIFTQ